MDYIENHIDPEPEQLRELDRLSHLKMVHGRMCSGHLQGRLLKMLVQLIGARRILELGTFTGYATLSLAEGLHQNLPSRPHSEGEMHTGRVPAVDTIEVFDENEDFLRKIFAESEYGDLINLIIGDALTEMAGMPPASYDLIYIDADKRQYPEYLSAAKRLLRPGGLLIADNTLWDGHVTDPARHDPQTVGIRRFNDQLAADPEFTKVILPLRDGLTLARLKSRV